MSSLVFDFSLLRSSREYLEARRSPWGTLLVGTITAALLGLGAWCAWGELEVVAKASSQVRPLNNISIVKNRYQGNLAQTNVTPGMWVNEGAILWIIDSRLTEIELTAAVPQRDRMAQRLRRLEKLLQSLRSRKALLVPQDGEEFVRWQAFEAEDNRMGLGLVKAEELLAKETRLPASLTNPQTIRELSLDRDLTRSSWNSWYIQTLVQVSDEARTVRQDLENMESKVATLNRQKTDATVLAPISGWIEETRKVNPGDLVQASEEILRIIPAKNMKLLVEVHLSAKDRADVRIGETIRLKFAALPPSEYGYLEGKVSVVPADSATDSSGQVYFRVIGEMDRHDLVSKDGVKVTIQPGMTAEARIVVKKRPVWRLLLETLDLWS